MSILKIRSGAVRTRLDRTRIQLNIVDLAVIYAIITRSYAQYKQDKDIFFKKKEKQGRA